MSYILIQEAYNVARPGVRRPLQTRLHVETDGELTGVLSAYAAGREDERIDEARIPEEVEPPGLIVEWRGLLNPQGHDISKSFPQYPWVGEAAHV